MKKIKLVILFLLLLSLFFYLDNRAYYYGFGDGYFSVKVPNYIRTHFRGTDMGNQGFAFIEKDIDIDVVDNLHPVYLLNNRKIIIKKIIGYGFDSKEIVAKVIDTTNKIRFIKVNKDISNQKYLDFKFEEVNLMPIQLKYIDLDKSSLYFNRLKLIKNIVFITLLFLLFYLIKLVYSNRKKIF